LGGGPTHGVGTASASSAAGCYEVVEDSRW